MDNFFINNDRLIILFLILFIVCLLIFIFKNLFSLVNSLFIEEKRNKDNLINEIIERIKNSKDA